MANDDGVTVRLLLPSTQSIPAEVEVAGGDLPSRIVSYAAGADNTSVPLVHEDGSVQVATVLHGRDSAAVFDYGLELPPNSEVAVTDSGAIMATQTDGSFVAGIAEPWAIDASGARVPTWYELTPGGFRQVVDHRVGAYVYPITADPWLGINLISTWSHSGGSFVVHVTPWMGAVNNAVADLAGWSELVSRVKSLRPTLATTLTSRATYRQQWACHAAGKEVIGIATFIGVDKRPAWELEGYRGTTWNYHHFWTHRCNW